MQCKIAIHLHVPAGHDDAGGCKGGGGELGDVKPAGALQVSVAWGNAGVQSVGVDFHGDGGLGRVGVVVCDVALDAAKAAVDVGDAHVADHKVDFAVSGVNGPGGVLRSDNGSSEADESEGKYERPHSVSFLDAG